MMESQSKPIFKLIQNSLYDSLSILSFGQRRASQDLAVSSFFDGSPQVPPPSHNNISVSIFWHPMISPAQGVCLFFFPTPFLSHVAPRLMTNCLTVLYYLYTFFLSRSFSFFLSFFLSYLIYFIFIYLSLFPSFSLILLSFFLSIYLSFFLSFVLSLSCKNLIFCTFFNFNVNFLI